MKQYKHIEQTIENKVLAESSQIKAVFDLDWLVDFTNMQINLMKG